MIVRGGLRLLRQRRGRSEEAGNLFSIWVSGSGSSEVVGRGAFSMAADSALRRCDLRRASSLRADLSCRLLQYRSGLVRAGDPLRRPS